MRRLWDVFCRVIDNFGDIGVCWRLAADLANRGQSVRLWVDDASALDWMAPGAREGAWPGVAVLPWSCSAQAERLAVMPRADIVVEGFGCEPEPAYLHWRFGQPPPPGRPPDWINLEYLSAEAYAVRSHGLPSPQFQGPATGHIRHFFFPGFGEGGGGLLREPSLARRQRDFDRAAWLRRWGVDAGAGGLVASLFCYEPPLLAAWLDRCRTAGRPVELLVTPGRASRAVADWLGTEPALASEPGTAPTICRGNLRCRFLPWLSQDGYDELLWACDLNFVRGEDSLVRALWAAKPWIWQIYPQGDGAHRSKLDALMDALDAPASWRSFHAAWNGVDGTLPPVDLEGWGRQAQAVAARLQAQPDLVTRLLRFTGDGIAAPGTGRETR